MHDLVPQGWHGASGADHIIGVGRIQDVIFGFDVVLDLIRLQIRVTREEPFPNLQQLASSYRSRAGGQLTQSPWTGIDSVHSEVL